MRIEKNNALMIEKALRTLTKMRFYKGLLLDYRKGILGEATVSVAKRIRTEFLVHFTNKENTISIISDKAIKLNKKQYTAFTELSFYDMGVLADKKRPYGFAFLKDDITSIYSLYTPLCFNKKAAEMLFSEEKFNPALINKLFVEPSASGQESIHVSVFSEIRTLEEIPLDRCCLFFRNDRIDDDDSIVKTLNDMAIFRLPYAPGWLFEFTSGGQKWIIKEDGTYLNFYDQRSTMTKAGDITEVGDKSIDDVILRLENVGGMKKERV